MCKCDVFHAAFFGTEAQPVCFHKDTVTAGLSLLVEFAKNFDAALKKQGELDEWLKGNGGCRPEEIVRKSERTLEIYKRLSKTTELAKILLGDMRIRRQRGLLTRYTLDDVRKSERL